MMSDKSAPTVCCFIQRPRLRLWLLFRVCLVGPYRSIPLVHDVEHWVHKISNNIFNTAYIVDGRETLPELPLHRYSSLRNTIMVTT